MWYQAPCNENRHILLTESEETVMNLPDATWSNRADRALKLILYPVKVGETLKKIAQNYGTSIEAIMALNKLTSQNVSPGTNIFINPGVRDPDKTGIPDPMGLSKYEHGNGTLLAEPKQIASFYDIQTDTNIKLYNHRSAFLFMSKAASRDKADTALCELNTEGKCVKYVDTNEVPYITIPSNMKNWVRLGDYAVVINTRNKKASYAYIADWETAENRPPDSTVTIRPTMMRGSLGGGSIALGKRLEIKDIVPDPSKGFEPEGVFYLIFPNTSTGIGRTKSVEEITMNAAYQFGLWDGMRETRKTIRTLFGKIV